MKKYKNIIQRQQIKISVPTWNDEFELPNESYFALDIQDYFEYIIKKT